jgi:hypothetical protein
VEPADRSLGLVGTIKIFHGDKKKSTRRCLIFLLFGGGGVHLYSVLPRIM